MSVTFSSFNVIPPWAINLLASPFDGANPAAIIASKIELSAAICTEGTFSLLAPLPNNDFAASSAALAASSPWTIFVISYAATSLAWLIASPSTLVNSIISSSGKYVSILKTFLTSASPTFLQYW